jgi:putative transposase
VPICRVLTEHGIEIAPSTYYALAAGRVSQADWDDAQAANRLLDLWRTHRAVYGVEKPHAAARRAGMDIGRDQTARLMAIVGIAGVIRGKHKTVTTHSDKSAPRHDDHCNRQWSTPTRPDQW